MKKNTVKALAAAMLICMTGCAKAIEEEPVEPSETSATEISEPEISEENTSEEAVSEDINVTEPDEKKPDAEDFFAFFSGADPVSGRIADNMDEAASAVSSEYSVEELSFENINGAIDSGNLSSTLFRFTMNGNSGILPSDSYEGNYFACEYNPDDSSDYVIIFGSGDVTTYREADKYISACGTAEYLALCTENDGQVILMPIAAGNSDCGIYGVIPNAEYMGYDMSMTESFDGIPESFSIRVTGASESGGMTTVYCKLDERFSEDVYFKCEKIFLNSENISEKVDADSTEKLENNGVFIFSDCEMKDGDALYFYGKICLIEDDSELYESGTAAVISSVESSDSSENE